MLLLFKKPYCTLFIKLFSSGYHISLRLIIFSSRLHKQLVSAIGLKLSGLV